MTLFSIPSLNLVESTSASDFEDYVVFSNYVLFRAGCERDRYRSGMGWWKHAVLTFRMVVLIGLGLFMVVGPGLRQVGGSKNVLFRNWVMYSGFGRKMCQVDYFTVSAEGVREPVDRFAVLGDKPWYSASKSLRRIATKKDVARVGSKICRKLPKGSDVRVISSCGSHTFWQSAHDGTEPLCGVSRRPVLLPIPGIKR